MRSRPDLSARVPGSRPPSRLGRRLVVVLALALLAGCSKRSDLGSGGDAGAKPGARLRIAVVPKGTTHEFWKSVHAGAVKAAREENVDLIWKGPLKEDDLRGQVDVVSTFVAQGVSGIVLAPLSDTGLRAPVRSAKEAKIPVVVFDSDLQGDDHVSFVATDNVAAGGLAAAALAKSVTKGPVAMLRYQEGSASTQNREKGFLEGIKKVPAVSVVSENQYGGATTESAFQKATTLLVAQKEPLAGLFAPNESTTFGALLALRQANLVRKTKLVGFDASDKLVAALEAGDIDGLVVQNPFRMGYLATKTLVDHLRGKPIERRIDTGARLVTKANLSEPDIKEVVRPDLKPYLGE